MTYQLHMERILSRLKDKRKKWGEYQSLIANDDPAAKGIDYVDFNSYWNKDWVEYGQSYCHFLKKFGEQISMTIGTKKTKQYAIEETLNAINDYSEHLRKRFDAIQPYIKSNREVGRPIFAAFARAYATAYTALAMEKRMIANEYGMLVWEDFVNEKGPE